MPHCGFNDNNYYNQMISFSKKSNLESDLWVAGWFKDGYFLPGISQVCGKLILKRIN